MLNELKQPQFEPMEATDQVISIWAASTGHLDDVPTDAVREFETDWIAYVKRNAPQLATAIMDGWDDDTVSKLEDLVSGFKNSWLAAREAAEHAREEAEGKTTEAALEAELGKLEHDVDDAEAQVAGHTPHTKHVE